MCLNITAGSFIAKRNITVYKIARKSLAIEGDYFAPYRGSQYVIGSPMEAEMHGYDNDIEEGLHSFANYSSAVEHCDELQQQNLGVEYVVMKAIIPKGAEYYEGKFVYWSGYASNKLTIVRELNRWDRFVGLVRPMRTFS